jgi:hypothetical protein
VSRATIVAISSLLRESSDGFDFAIGGSLMAIIEIVNSRNLKDVNDKLIIK